MQFFHIPTFIFVSSICSRFIKGVIFSKKLRKVIKPLILESASGTSWTSRSPRSAPFYLNSNLLSHNCTKRPDNVILKRIINIRANKFILSTFTQKSGGGTPKI